MQVKKLFIVTLCTVLITDNCESRVQLECGKPKITETRGNELTVSGQDTAPGDWPWHAAIYHRDGSSTNYVCGGTVISEQIIVTAAHCVINAANGFRLVPSRIFVRLGIHDLDSVNSAFAQKHEVEKIFKFANSPGLIDDIAVIRLRTIIRITDYVQLACVNVVPNIIGKYGTVVGWGLMENNETSSTLKKADLLVVAVDSVMCLQTDRVLFGLAWNEGLSCAGYTKGTGDCSGVTGGGLFFRRANTWFFGGILSLPPDRSNQCYMNGYGAFTAVHHYVSWINEVTGIRFQQNNDVQFDEAVKSELLPRHCGIHISNRIAGRVQAKVFEFPWMALIILDDKKHTCQGTMISKRYILTAAHCFRYRKPIKVRLGEHTIDQDIDCSNQDEDCAPPVRDYNIEYITTHPQFQWPLDNDIALLRLSKDVEYADHIQPICLPHTPDLENYQPPQYIITGWGRKNVFGDFSNALQRVTIPIVNESECQHRSPFYNTKKHLCAGKEDIGFCAADGGMPLGYGAVQHGMRFVQFGMVVQGVDCSLSGTLFVNLSYYMDWIIANMKP